MTFPGLDSGILKRLDRIERVLAELVATDRERRLLLGIAESTKGTMFAAHELLSHAALVPALQALLVAALGPEQLARRAGKFLARLNGCTVGGVSVERVGREHGAVLWRVSVAKLPAPVALSAVIADDADST